MTEHITSTRTYLIVAGILLLLTVTTVLVAGVDLGPWNSVVAIGIASTKALLIAVFFMHLRHSPGLTRLAVLAGLLWLAILIAGTADDYLTRGWLLVPPGK